MPGPRDPTTRTCISLRSDQFDALRRLSRETGAPVAELTRRAVDAYLATRVGGYIQGSPHPALGLFGTGHACETPHS